MGLVPHGAVDVSDPQEVFFHVVLRFYVLGSFQSAHRFPVLLYGDERLAVMKVGLGLEIAEVLGALIEEFRLLKIPALRVKVRQHDQHIPSKGFSTTIDSRRGTMDSDMLSVAAWIFAFNLRTTKANLLSRLFPITTIDFGQDLGSGIEKSGFDQVGSRFDGFFHVQPATGHNRFLIHAQSGLYETILDVDIAQGDQGSPLKWRPCA